MKTGRGRRESGAPSLVFARRKGRGGRKTARRGRAVFRRPRVPGEPSGGTKEALPHERREGQGWGGRPEPNALKGARGELSRKVPPGPAIGGNL
ncbi:hypothetical protein CE91St45_22190 [Oscillospiraceae bacterium]|nr:hypothetical protein CE91St45_22190 [Oscillospiraceae bacterium]